MTVVTPFELIGTATEGGTWDTDETTGVAPLPPDAPALFDDSMDFDGVTPGTYVYRYTVSEAGCDDAVTTVTFNISKGIPVKNDDCVDARSIVFPYNGGTSILHDQTIASSCPGTLAPTMSGTAVPSAWTGLDLGVDVWFKVTFDETYPLVPIIACSFTIDGTPYGAGGIMEPVLAIYDDCAGSLLEADVPGGGSQDIDIMIPDVYSSAITFYLRVSCPEGYEGKFDVILSV